MASTGRWGGGQVQGVFCRCVLVSTLKIGRFWQGGRLLLEKDALSFLHPRVVLHQLRVQEGILRDAVLYPLHQISNCFGGLLSFEGQLVLEALHLLLHLGQVHLIHDCSLMQGFSTSLMRRCRLLLFPSLTGAVEPQAEKTGGPAHGQGVLFPSEKAQKKRSGFNVQRLSLARYPLHGEDQG